MLTTNFDTLFERAAVAGALADVPSHSGKSLPKAGGARDFGVLHLHGRIADEKLGLAETDFVLTSADFGDAYLRDGWASRIPPPAKPIACTPASPAWPSTLRPRSMVCRYFLIDLVFSPRPGDDGAQRHTNKTEPYEQ